MAVEKKEMKEEFVVVKELPAQEVRQITKEEVSTTFNLITTEEALTEIIKRLDRLEKRITR